MTMADLEQEGKQHLIVNNSEDASQEHENGQTETTQDNQEEVRENELGVVGCQAYLAVALLCLVNLLNYVDRYTVAANLAEIQKYFDIANNNSAAGLIQTVFIVGYMLTSPIFGYLGDRFPRKIIIAAGITAWSGLTLAGSFVTQDQLGLFILIRGAVGIGEASYVTIAASIIGDLFVGNRRTRMLMVFYFAIPVGSGLGYIAGKALATAFHSWTHALQVTPAVGMICVILIILFLKEPKRGQAETHNSTLSNTGYKEDLKAFSRNKTYIFSTLGLTSQCWVTGALALWAVKTIEFAYTLQGMNPASVSYIFGALTCIAGIVGVGGGTTVAQYMRPFNPRADPLVCAFGMLVGSFFLFLGLYVLDSNIIVAWTFILIAEILLFLNWALIPDILLYVLIPTRRASGNAIQMLISHLLGDAFSPWFIGFLSDRINSGMSAPRSTHDEYYSLVYALYCCAIVTALGGGAFLATALYVEKGKKRVQDILERSRAGNAAEALHSENFVN